MGQTYELSATVRDKVGKGAARAVRRQGQIPAVIYGGKQPPVAIHLSDRDVYFKIHGGGFLTTVATIDVGGEKVKVTVSPGMTGLRLGEMDSGSAASRTAAALAASAAARAMRARVGVITAPSSHELENSAPGGARPVICATPGAEDPQAGRSTMVRSRPSRVSGGSCSTTAVPASCSTTLASTS